jgi:tetratricopeptide (TPR) repeat protein
MKVFPVLLIYLLALVSILVSCATTVTVQVQQPPAWNTAGIQRIAIMPFAMTQNTPLQRRAASLLNSVSRSRIQAVKRFTLIDPEEVQRVQNAKGNVGNYADAIFSGQIISAASQDSQEYDSRRDKEGNIVRYTIYKRDVQLSFNFTLSRTSDAQVMGTDTMNFSNSYSSEDWKSLKSVDDVIQEMVQKGMAGITYYLVPYTLTEKREFETVQTKDKAIKKRAKDASALVKKGNYKSAEEAFLGIYRDTDSFAAAYNAGLLLELQGNLEGAAILMQRLYDETGNQKAALSIGRLQKAIDNAGLLDAYTKNQALPQVFTQGPSEPL